jgi:hypothetical protein
MSKKIAQVGPPAEVHYASLRVRPLTLVHFTCFK